MPRYVPFDLRPFPTWAEFRTGYLLRRGEFEKLAAFIQKNQGDHACQKTIALVFQEEAGPLMATGHRISMAGKLADIVTGKPDLEEAYAYAMNIAFTQMLENSDFLRFNSILLDGKEHPLLQKQFTDEIILRAGKEMLDAGYPADFITLTKRVDFHTPMGKALYGLSEGINIIDKPATDNLPRVTIMLEEGQDHMASVICQCGPIGGHTPAELVEVWRETNGDNPANRLKLKLTEHLNNCADAKIVTAGHTPNKDGKIEDILVPGADAEAAKQALRSLEHA